MPPLESEITEKYLKAGQAVAKALKLGYKLARPGTNLYDLATILENSIIENGADGWSFPANLSLDVEAAHYSPIIDDSKILPKEGLLKIDLGGHVDGYVSDAAITKNLGNSEKYKLCRSHCCHTYFTNKTTIVNIILSHCFSVTLDEKCITRLTPYQGFFTPLSR